MKNEYFVIDVLFLRKKNPLKQEGKFDLYKKVSSLFSDSPLCCYLRIEKKTIFMAPALR